VTYRGVAAQVTLISSCFRTGEELDFAHLARTPRTLVFVMGLRQLGTIVDQLLAHGKGTRHSRDGALARALRDGEVVVGELRELPELARG
jgi:siroheme synthase